MEANRDKRLEDELSERFHQLKVLAFQSKDSELPRQKIPGDEIYDSTDRCYFRSMWYLYRAFRSHLLSREIAEKQVEGDRLSYIRDKLCAAHHAEIVKADNERRDKVRAVVNALRHHEQWDTLETLYLVFWLLIPMITEEVTGETIREGVVNEKLGFPKGVRPGDESIEKINEYLKTH